MSNTTIKLMFTSLIPIPQQLKAQSSAHDLKTRLDWGEPALTILDVRSNEMFRKLHITGALSMPMDKLVPTALSSLEQERDIYIYGETDEQTFQAAELLRQAGFIRVAELKGGVSSWKAVKGAVEGHS